MTATAGFDASGPVEYYFAEISGNAGGTDSGWQTSASYTDTGLAAKTQYTYTVKMRDAVGNEGTASSGASATTQAATGLYFLIK
jgi:endo-1,4-beta-xylanase